MSASPEPLEEIAVPQFEAMLDPQLRYAELAARGPIVLLRNPQGQRIYTVTDWDLAHTLLRDHRFSKSAENARLAVAREGINVGRLIAGIPGNNLLNTDPPDHTRLRSLVNLTFSPRRIEVMRERVENLVAQLIAPLKGKREADLIGEFAYPIGITMICELLGIPAEDRGNFRDWATKAMTRGHPESVAAGDALLGYLSALIAAKRARIESNDPDAHGDLLSAMIVARLADDKLTDQELVSMSFLLLVAGHETTVGLIGNALFHLARNRDQLALLVAEPDLITQAIEEILRYDPPVHTTTGRVTAEEVELAGVRIPRSSRVQVLIPSCNRDPTRFPDPEKFDITRTETRHLAFGHGAHTCVGLHLARLEARTAVGAAVAAFPNMSLACAPEDMPWARTVIRAPAKLPMRLNVKPHHQEAL